MKPYMIMDGRAYHDTEQAEILEWLGFMEEVEAREEFIRAKLNFDAVLCRLNEQEEIEVVYTND